MVAIKKALIKPVRSFLFEFAAPCDVNRRDGAALLYSSGSCFQISEVFKTSEIFCEPAQGLTALFLHFGRGAHP